MSVEYIKQGPNWGAGLRALGDALGGYANLQYQQQQDELARQRQLEDEQRLWAHQAQVAKDEALQKQREDPMVRFDQQTIPIPTLTGVIPMPNPRAQNVPEWATPGQAGVPLSEYNKNNFDWNVLQEQLANARLLNEQDNARMLEAARTAAAARAAGGRSTVADERLFEAQLSDFAKTSVTPDELKIWGAGLEDMFKQAARDYFVTHPDAVPSAALGDMIQQSILDRQGMVPNLVPGMERAPTGEWFDPTRQQFFPGEKNSIFQRDIPPGIAPISDNLTGMDYVRAISKGPDDEKVLTDYALPALKAGYITEQQLQRWASKQGISWARAQAILQLLAQAQGGAPSLPGASASADNGGMSEMDRAILDIAREAQSGR